MAEQKNAYRLYRNDNMLIPSGVRFSLVSHDAEYALVYTDLPKERLRGFTPVEESSLSDETLPSERDWLFACKAELQVEADKKEKDEFLSKISGFLDLLEKNLQAESEKLKGATENERSGGADN